MGGSGGAANVSIAADIFESGRARRAVVIADGAGAALDGVGGARILSARIHTSQDGDDFRATIFAGGEELRLERLTHTVFANLAGAEKYLSHAEWEKFFANAEYSNSRDGRRAAVFAEGEGLSGIFGEVVSLQLRANAKTKADDWESRIALALRDVFSPYAGSALAVNATAALSQTESGTLRATFAMALDESEFLFMPVEAPSFRALRTRGEFSGGPDGEWNLHLPETRIELGAAESENTTAPVVSSFPIRVGAAGAQGGEKVSAFPFSHSSSRTTPTGPTQFESGRAKTVPTESESIIQASLFAFGGEDAARGWRVSAGGRNLRMAEAWRYLPDRAALRDLREWLRESVPAGIISRGRLAVSGAEVSLSGVFDRGRIVIGDGWPDAENLSGAFSFADGQVAIDGEGVFDGLPIADVAARAPNVFADAVTLFLDIHPAPQPLPRYLQTALDLPEAMDYRAGVESYDLRGRGMLSIAAVIPLAKGAPNSFAANLQVEDGVFSDLQNPAVPPLESVSGAVALTDDASSGAFTGAMRGLPAALNFAGDGDFDLRAKMDSQEAMKIAEVDLPLRGTLAFELSRRGEMTLFTSDLRGVEFLLPAPFDKNSESPAPVFARVLGETTRLSLQVNGNEVRALLRGDENGAVGLNADPGELPESGFRLVGGASGADVDGWLALAFGGDGDSDLGGELILTLTNAKALGKTVSALTATVRAPRGKPLQGWVGAPDLRGKFSVDFQAGGGAAELAYVNLSSGPNDADAERGGGGMEMFFAPRDFALTATITELRRDGELLGGGAGVIRGSPDSWRLADGVLILGENRMMASAEYIAGPSPRTSVSLRLVASDLPGVTRGLGLGDFVQRGALTVSGKLNWKLPPTALGFAGMAGRLRLDASDIRYQAEGGGGAVTGVVNFLSVFSPLSLLTLGFLKAGQRESILDRVGCDIVIEDGVAKFPGVLIENEDVVINMTGETDLVNRRHDLRGEVKPGDKILKAVGPALAATGQLPALVVVEVVRRVFAKPLSNLGAYEYAIRGDWDNPEYEERGEVEAPDADGGEDSGE